jgi:hypothetical protein
MSKKSFAGVNNDINTHHTYPILSFLIGLMALGIILSAGVFAYTTYNNFANNKPTSSFTVTGEAEKENEATEAKLRFQVSQTGPDVNAINTKVDAQTVAIKKYLTDTGITNENIEINKNTNEEYVPYINSQPTSPSPKNQVVTVDFVVKFKNTKNININDVNAKLLALGVTNTSQFDFEISNKDAICENLIDLAIKNAKEQADKRLKTIGGDKIVRTAIDGSATCGDDFTYPIAYANETVGGVAAQKTDAPDVLQGNKKLKASVFMTVDYR